MENRKTVGYEKVASPSDKTISISANDGRVSTLTHNLHGNHKGAGLGVVV